MADYVTREELTEALAKTESKIIDQVREIVRDAQTELLRGFEHYAKIHDTSFRKLKADHANFETAYEIRLANLEEEMSEMRARLIKAGI